MIARPKLSQLFAGCSFSATIAASVLAFSVVASSQGAYTVLHSFTGGTDGANPGAVLIRATDGNFYGTTAGGGVFSLGTVFKMTPRGTLTILNRFSFLAR